MGVHIPNMDKPKNCGECPLMRGSYCAITDNFYFEEADYDPTSCPLEEVDDIAFGLYKAYIDGIEPPETPKEIVRCKECKRSRTYTMDSNLPISRWCHKFSVPVAVEDDGYCSDGERRTDE